jgi:hypothetical protein
MSGLYVGYRGVLVPNRPTAPSVAYVMPEITVAEVNGPRITVKLPDGSTVETDQANIQRFRPEPAARTSRSATERPAPQTETLF